MRHIAIIILALLGSCSSGFAADAKVGDSVFAFFQAGEAYFAATVVEEVAADKGQFRVVFEDGDTALVAQSQMKTFEVKAGANVFARWKNGKFYEGKIAKVVGRAVFIEYKDGDKGWASIGNIATK